LLRNEGLGHFRKENVISVKDSGATETMYQQSDAMALSYQ